MGNSTSRLHYLYTCFINDTGTPDEIREFWTLLQEAPEDHPIRNAVFALYEETAPDTASPVDWAPALQRILGHARPQPRKSRAVQHWWAAASIIFLAGIGAYFFYQARLPGTAVKKNIASQETITPGGLKAILKTQHGEVVLKEADTSFVLAGNTIRINGGNVQIAAEKPAQYTLITPRGGEYRLTLADGTTVWLNASSKLEYPSVFAGNTREVSLEGEAFFEVAQDVTHPFIVHTEKQRITVLGTAFNIHAYPDESESTTLINGKVRVNSAGNTLLLQPGQQALLDSGGQLRLDPDADLEEVAAWKNGYFQFNKADIRQIMQQLSRWYNVDVEYASSLPSSSFGAIISRTNSISKILDVLEATGEVHFKVEGRHIYVMP